MVPPEATPGRPALALAAEAPFVAQFAARGLERRADRARADAARREPSVPDSVRAASRSGRSWFLRPARDGKGPTGVAARETPRYLPARSWVLSGFSTYDFSVYTFEGSTAGLYVFPEEENPDFRVLDLSPPAPPPSIINLVEDFEGYPEGGTPTVAGFRTEGLGDSVRIESESAPWGVNRYLQITDSPRLKSPDLPTFWYAPYHRLGETFLSFDLRVDAATALRHEWRERRVSPSRIGPSFEIRGGALIVAGRSVAGLPVDQWVRITIAARLGAGGDGAWDLWIEQSDGTYLSIEGLDHEDRDFALVGWLGFRSISSGRAVWCLDNVSLENSLEDHVIEN